VPTGFGPRFLVEAGFIIAAAAVAGIERLRTVTIIVVVAAAWAVVAVVELILELRRRRRRAREYEPVPGFEDAYASEPAPDPYLAPPPIPEVEPAEPEPTPIEPHLVAVAAEPPSPVVEPAPAEPEPEPASRVVSLVSRRTGPREWNVWDLERIAREQAGDDVARNEERSYLLMYLREFANADGVLPADFDGVVRETFGDVLDAAYTS
jgi:hypothetical protein